MLVGLILAFVPIGAYVVFGVNNQSLDSPVEKIGIMVVGTQLFLPVDLTLGYVFGAFWCAYAAMVAVALMGPHMRIIRAVKNIVSGHGNTSWLYQNHMVAVVTWFTILILASTLIDVVQTSFGVLIRPPDYVDDLDRFYNATKAPVIEEVGFRVLLIGAPLAGLYMFRQSPARTLRSLLNPYSVHGDRSIRVALVLVIVSATFFGILHIVGDGSWSPGKVTQAGVAGAILGWVYYRHGLLTAILVHWATNYFLFAYLYFVAIATDTVLFSASTHVAALGLEILLIVSGIVAVALLALGQKRPRLDAEGVY